VGKVSDRCFKAKPIQLIIKGMRNRLRGMRCADALLRAQAPARVRCRSTRAAAGVGEPDRAASWNAKTWRRTNPIATNTQSRNGHVHSPTRLSSASPKKITMQSMSGR
jgi:hypothetical protein